MQRLHGLAEHFNALLPIGVFLDLVLKTQKKYVVELAVSCRLYGLAEHFIALLLEGVFLDLNLK